MVPKISERYFQALLVEQDALEAVSTISGFWSHRMEASKPMFGLRRPEYICQLVLIYTGEIGNGGHSQFFLNRDHGYIADCIEALHAVRLQDLATILRQASKVPGNRKRLHQLDQEVWSNSLNVDRALQTFLQENSDHVLLEERPSPKG